MPDAMILNRPDSGWARLASAVAETVPVQEIDRVWLFRTWRREGSEWGTALLSRLDGDREERRRIYTARFMHVLKGKERGKFTWVLEEVGSGPLETLGDLVAGVCRRLDDEEPRPVAPHEWFPPAAHGTPRQD